MSEYYKITKLQATAIGKFKINDCESFDPLVGEQTDGTYLIEVSWYDSLKGKLRELLNVDFSKLPKIKDSQVSLKPFRI